MPEVLFVINFILLILVVCSYLGLVRKNVTIKTLQQEAETKDQQLRWAKVMMAPYPRYSIGSVLGLLSDIRSVGASKVVKIEFEDGEVWKAETTSNE